MSLNNICFFLTILFLITSTTSYGGAKDRKKTQNEATKSPTRIVSTSIHTASFSHPDPAIEKTLLAVEGSHLTEQAITTNIEKGLEILKEIREDRYPYLTEDMILKDFLKNNENYKSIKDINLKKLTLKNINVHDKNKMNQLQKFNKLKEELNGKTFLNHKKAKLKEYEKRYAYDFTSINWALFHIGVQTQKNDGAMVVNDPHRKIYEFFGQAPGPHKQERISARLKKIYKKLT